MGWICFFLGLIISIVLIRIRIKKGNTVVFSDIICFLTMGQAYVFLIWGFFNAIISTLPEDIVERKIECVVSYDLEKLNEDEYIKTIYVNDGSANSSYYKAIQYKYDNTVLSSKVKNVKILFNEDYNKYEIYKKKFKNNVLSFFFRDINASWIEISIDKESINGDFLLTENDI